MLRFTIRDVLWLMVVVGMGVAWWIEHREVVRLHGELARSVKWTPAGGGAMSVNEYQPPATLNRP